jgi:hypothetical protein
MHRSSLVPNKTDAPLVVDPNRVLPLPIRLQRFEPISWRNAKIVEDPGLIQKTKFSQSDVLNVWRQFSAPPSRSDQFDLGIGEVLDHIQL